jgi:pilus assembly protein CpaC
LAGTTTGQFGPPTAAATIGTPPALTLTQALNVFLFRPDINLGANIQALESRNLLQILAEPNVLALNGRSASFLAGGEFPYPTVQTGVSLGAVTVAYREFGVRITFVPVVTPRGTIRMQVSPEVSSLDYSNSLVFNGFTIPAISTRRVSTEVELETGQSFAIGGLLDNRVTETWNKIPGLGDIPFFGKLFRSRNQSKNNTELLVLVTPEIVRPIPTGQPTPELKMPREYMPPNTSKTPPQTPSLAATGPAPEAPTKTIPVEELLKSLQPPQQIQQNPQTIQYVPMLVSSGTQSAAPAQPAAPQAAPPQPASPAPVKP